MNPKFLLRRILNGHLNNVAFSDFINLTKIYGFKCIYVKGSHYIYKNPLVEEALNLQPKNGEAKPYQIRQFLELVEQYDLHPEKDQ